MLQHVALYWETEFRREAAEGRARAVFEEGEEVFVKLRSDKSTGRANVTKVCEGDRVRISYHEEKASRLPDEDPQSVGGGGHQDEDGDDRGGGGLRKGYDARASRLLHVVDRSRRCVVVCGPTVDFRQLCRTQVVPEDRVLEIGCSYGLASQVLVDQLGLCREGGGGGALVCVDVSEEGVARTEKLCRGARNAKFLVADLLDGTGDALRGLYGRAGEAPTLVFVDIGGNREASDVRGCVRLVAEALPSVRQIVVKSEQVFDILQRGGGQAVQARRPGGGPPPAGGGITQGSGVFWVESGYFL